MCACACVCLCEHVTRDKLYIDSDTVCFYPINLLCTNSVVSNKVMFSFKTC